MTGLNRVNFTFSIVMRMKIADLRASETMWLSCHREAIIIRRKRILLGHRIEQKGDKEACSRQIAS